ncbi:radical SAM/SPASM domain-containing protein [Lactococcus carnosus]|uniref:radical SAM/SPASM domain-containing protein n=1 Tax=Pseudolactococcus carnosus TaxID=2749961 RepID=UPI001FBBBA70|nr:radical SAM protein [Lactococcus carnosus]MBR2833081.1 radical SAM protein [Bacilli bacterium]MBR3208782.1 radical SAM protein [Bacilli bacterium]MCJ1971407.1 radical SAM protein [Lactococcus carnosus]
MKKEFTGLHFELTNQCNLRCTHCYNIDYLESNKEDLSTNEIKKIIDSALEIGVRDIGFSGGEPFMRKDIYDLLEYSKNNPVHVLTNGMFITKNTIKKLNAIDGLLVEFRISLDGLSSHKDIRGVSYKAALRGIKLLLDNGYVTSVNTMITNDNISQLMEMYELFSDIGLDRWRLGFIFSQGNAGKNSLSFDCKDEQLSKIKELILRHMNEKPVFEMDISKLYRSGVLDGAHIIQYDLESKPCSYQGALTVRPNGDVSYCPSLDIKYGNLVKDDINDVLNNPKWLDVYDFQVNQLPQKCLNCEYVKYCGGGCRADSYYDNNDLYSYSDMTCKLIKYYVEELAHLFTDMPEPYII